MHVDGPVTVGVEPAMMIATRTCTGFFFDLISAGLYMSEERLALNHRFIAGLLDPGTLVWPVRRSTRVHRPPDRRVFSIYLVYGSGWPNMHVEYLLRVERCSPSRATAFWAPRRAVVNKVFVVERGFMDEAG